MLSNWRSPPRPVEKSAEEGALYNRNTREISRWRESQGWVPYFRIGNSSYCFSYIRRWVEMKIRRHIMRARKRRGFGWSKWSMSWVYDKLGLFDEYLVRYYTP